MAMGHDADAGGSRSGAASHQIEEEARLQSSRYQMGTMEIPAQRPPESEFPLVVHAIPLKDVMHSHGSGGHAGHAAVTSPAVQRTPVIATEATTPGIPAAIACLSPRSDSQDMHVQHSIHTGTDSSVAVASASTDAVVVATPATIHPPLLTPMMMLSRELLVKLWPKERALAGRLVCKMLAAELSTVREVMLAVSERSLGSPLFNRQGIQDMIMKFGSFGVDVRDETLCSNVKEQSCKHSKCNQKETGITLAEGLIECFKNGFINLVGVKIGISCKDTRKNLIRRLKYQPDLGTLSLRAIDDADIKSLAKILARCEQLETLDLSRNDFGIEGSRALSSVLEQAGGKLTSLDLSCTRIGVDGCEALAQNLPHCSSLKRLILGRNLLQDEGVRHLSLRVGDLASLTHLDVSSNDIRVDGAKALAQRLAQCRRLQYIDLSENSIKCEGAVCLGSNLILCKYLTHLILSACSIRGEGISALARTLKQWNRIEHINLARNDLRAEGSKKLAEVLASCTELTHLNLSENRLGAKGAKLVADAIVGCPRMKHLDLGSNRIRDDGAEKLADTFQKLRNLETIKLGLNCFGSPAAKSLSEAWRETTKLKHLDLSGNGLSSKDALLLFQALAGHVMTCIDLSQNLLISQSDPDVKLFLDQLEPQWRQRLLGSVLGWGGN